MSNYKLSIITINLNNLSGLKRTVESVVNQTWKDFEHIVIDGGSTDGSAEYIQEMQEYFNFWVCEPDKGIYNAMNKGIKQSSSDYLLFLNSGDSFIDENSMATIFDEINLNVDFISFAVIDSLGKKSDAPKILSAAFFLTNILPHQSTLIRRNLFTEFLYNENYKIVSEWEFFIRKIVIEGASYVVLSKVIVCFDAFGISNQENYKTLQNEERNQVIESVFSKPIQYDLYELLELKQKLNKRRLRLIEEIERSVFLSWCATILLLCLNFFNMRGRK